MSTPLLGRGMTRWHSIRRMQDESVRLDDVQVQIDSIAKWSWDVPKLPAARSVRHRRPQGVAAKRLAWLPSAENNKWAAGSGQMETAAETRRCTRESPDRKASFTPVTRVRSQLIDHLRPLIRIVHSGPGFERLAHFSAGRVFH
jgi:hypothetical protein